jgi:hydroxyethylthiazole kinase-like uncharacterized protein yjeF
MKLLSKAQIQELDQVTIASEGISSLDLMERAASALFNTLLNHFNKAQEFWIFCGPGNNGGDGLVIARLLYNAGKVIKVINVGEVPKRDDGTDRAINYKCITDLGEKIIQFEPEFIKLSTPAQECVIIDALFGNGLNKPLNETFAKAVEYMNTLNGTKVAIDVPSGLYADGNEPNASEHIFKADFTYTLQLPKSSFFHRYWAPYVGHYQIIDIGLNPSYIAGLNVCQHLFSQENAHSIYKPRTKFTYKNSYGHALLMAGSQGTPGAAFLCAKSCARGGTGLLSVSIPKNFSNAFISYLPEAMLLEDKSPSFLSALPDLKKFDAVGFGPGVGEHAHTQKLFVALLKQVKKSLVLDADAISMLATHPEWVGLLPEHTILTPHIGEFKRLLKLEELPYDYLVRATTYAVNNKVVLLLKDSISSIHTPDGDVHFVDEGSPAMATAGSGDVLMGLILALLANGYTAKEAALLGAFVHGKAGKLAGLEIGEESVLAGDIPKFFGDVFKSLKD